MNRGSVPQPVRFFLASRSGETLLALAALVALYFLRIALLPFALAGAIAFVATPVLNRLSRLMPRWLAATTTFLSLLLVLAGLTAWVFKVVAPGASTLSHDAPRLIRAILVQLTGSDHPAILGMHLDADTIVRSASDAMRSNFGDPGHFFIELIGLAMGAFLTVLLTLFFLLGGPRLASGALALVPPDRRPAAARLARNLRPMLMRYVIGVIVIAAATGALSFMAFGLIVHLPHALMISIATAVLETVPVAGPIAAALLVGLIAISTGSTAMVVGMVIAAMGIRLFVDQVLAPVIFGKVVSLPPAVVLLAFVVGGVLYGMLGVLLAVPVAAGIKIALQTHYGEFGQPPKDPPAMH